MAEYTVLEKEVEYIPTSYGNADADKPAIFHLRYITNAERTRCMNTAIDRNGNVEVEFDNEALVKYGVNSIEDFIVNGKAIVTGRDFNNAVGFPEMHMEVATQVLTLNARQDSKNSE